MFESVGTGVKFPELEEEILKFWDQHSIFAKTVEARQDCPEFVFYEGPPTANGRPGVHHVQARAYKDLFPRYKTMRGYQVRRKAGWDCHGLPVELEVEKKLGLSGKPDVEKYGVEPFNKLCRESVMEYEGVWREMTRRIGFWIDLDDAYMTMTNDFVESVWWSLKELWKKDLLYRGYKVVPFCAKDGTPLSSHEVGLGYKEVTDPSIYVRFPLDDPEALGLPAGTAMLVWTTTPWTLPGNTAAAVSPELDYEVVPLGDEHILLAKPLVEKALKVEGYTSVASLKGSDLVGATYQAPYRFMEFDKPGHRVVAGEFVTAEDGTGIVHIAPAFGADDLEMAHQFDLPVARTVDATGHFVAEVTPFAGTWFKAADPRVIEDLTERGILYRKEDYVHSYPHCWRCRNPLMYYATDSWFIANTRLQERLKEKNQELDWHPAHIKSGRYGDWLNNLVDWALSRTRYWGTPLPIWECQGCGHRDCIGSYAELGERSQQPLAEPFDPHRPYVDEVKLTCGECGGTMERVPEVIDCWYDSGAMPFAQLHYPFENKERFEKTFPADFICEGLDQTRGWFNSLHQLGVMLFDNIAYKTVICHGLVLDGEGEKMSKSRGNVVDPWEVLNEHGADSLRWYLYASAPPELSRRFSVELVGEACRRYLSTLWNTYHFFVLNANAAQPDFSLAKPASERDGLDRFVLSRLNQLVSEVTTRMDAFELTPAARALQDFVDELSNWYVRRSRRRFWDGDVNAYTTLYECLLTMAKLSAPFTPFLSESMYQNLRRGEGPESVHLCPWPKAETGLIDEKLMLATEMVMKVVSIGRAARNQSGQRVRQPLAEVLVRVRSAAEQEGLESLKDQILEELNVKSIRFLKPGEDFLDYDLKPNLRLVGRKYGKKVPALKKVLAEADGKSIARAVKEGQNVSLDVEGETLELEPEELLVEARSPEGYEAQEEGGILVAISTEVTHDLLLEGVARDLVRHIQDLRKNSELDISDRIRLWVHGANGKISEALDVHKSTIMDETLALEVSTDSPPSEAHATEVDLAKDGNVFTLALFRLDS